MELCKTLNSFCENGVLLSAVYHLSAPDSKTLNKTPAKLTNFYLMTCLYQSRRKIANSRYSTAVPSHEFEIILAFHANFLMYLKSQKGIYGNRTLKNKTRQRCKYYFICYLFFNNLFLCEAVSIKEKIILTRLACCVI